MNRTFLAVALIFAATIAFAVPASALSTWDLTNSNLDLTEGTFFFGFPLDTPTILSNPYVFTNAEPVSITATGKSLANNSLQGLNQNIRGLGVTGGLALSYCAAYGIDQCSPAEYVQFDFANPSWTPISATLTMLDKGDDFLIIADTDGLLSTTGDNQLLFSGSGLTGTQTIALPNFGAFQHLYITTVAESDCSNTFNCGPGENDVFRVSQVQGEVAVPEPGTLLLCGIALTAIGYVRRRR